MASNTTSDLPILIIGAGISGLALAHGLRLRSIPFRLFERTPKSHISQGHRFRISADGVTALKSIVSPETWELLTRTAPERASVEPRYVDARLLNFEKPTKVEHPDSMPIDRSWLRMLLIQGIEDAIEYDKEFQSFEAIATGIKVVFGDHSSAYGSSLIGADGIKSRIRSQIQPRRRLLDLERWIAWGRTPLTTSLRRQLPRDVMTWFMAIDSEANTQAVIEPMLWTKSAQQASGQKLPGYQDYIYWAVATEGSPRDPWTAEGRKEFLKEMTKSWDPNLRLVFDSAAYGLSACVPVLSSKPDIEMTSSVSKGMVTIIGDAAHPMSPMGGSGGDLSIQGVADLLLTIDKFGLMEESMRNFEEGMERRAKPKLERSFQNGQKFWRGKQWYEYRKTSDN